MGWSNDDGTHEGYVRAEFADGIREVGVVTGSVPDDQVITAWQTSPSGADRYETRPAAEVVGWRVMCDCRTGPTLSSIKTWASPTLILRVATEDRHSPSKGRLFVVDHDVTFVDELFRELCVARWRQEHVRGDEVLEEVAQARRNELAAAQRINASVAIAREYGHSWAAIGSAADMSRQAARQRWGRPTP